MKKTIKCFITLLIMTVVYVVTGITAQAMETAIVPKTWSDAKQTASVVANQYTVPANSHIIIPIDVPGKGGIILNHTYLGKVYLKAEIYEDAACTTYVKTARGTNQYLGNMNSDKYVKRDVNIANKGTYYIKVENKNRTDATYMIECYFVNGNDRTITTSKSNVIFQNDSQECVYQKFVAKKTGYLAVTASDYSGAAVFIKLTDNKKKDLSNENVVGPGTVHFGVQKGKTYYIATKGYDDCVYSVSVKNVAIKEKSGSNQKKAVTIKKNKTVKGVQIANKKSNDADWYKFTLKSPKKVKITVSGGATDFEKKTSDSDIEVMIIPANSNYYIRNTRTYAYVLNNQKSYIETKSKLAAGTYYIKVYKNDKLSSGWYSIKWK